MSEATCVYGVARENALKISICASCPFNEANECVEAITGLLCLEQRIGPHRVIVIYKVITPKKFLELYQSHYELEKVMKDGFTSDAIGQGEFFKAWRLWKRYPDYTMEA